MKSILIRCDANELNGYGHLSRCINMARGIKEKNINHNVTFIGDYSPDAISLIEKRNFGYTIFREHVASSALNLMPTIKNYECFILDSYDITQNYIDQLSNQAFKFCLIADDSTTLNLASVDLVVNYAINGQDFDYKSKGQALGLKYFPVKPEFKAVREKNILKKDKEINHILLMIGGHDKYSVGVNILKIIDGLVMDKTITYISSATSFDALSIKNNRLKFLPFCENIEDIYADVDFTITGGGLSKYESNYCNIMNASVPQNINEYNDSTYFEAKGLTTIIGIAYNYSEATVSSNMAKLLNSSPCPPPDLFYTDSLDNLIDKILH